jgi:hypothetical protein
MSLTPYIISTFSDIVVITEEFISKTTQPHPCPLPPGERGLIISPPLMGGDEGEGDTCGFTNDCVSNRNNNLKIAPLPSFSKSG